MISLIRDFYHQIKLNRGRGSSINEFRYFFNWKTSLESNASSITDEQPWITFRVIDFLNNRVNNESIVCEFGGGGSTLYFSRRAKKVITIEHDPIWFEKLSEILGKNKINNWQGFYIPPELGNIADEIDKSNPDDYSSEDTLFKGYNFKNYACKIDEFPNNHFDIVLIDGRSRPSCIKHSIRKLKVGGYLIIDNSERDYYLVFFNDILQLNFIPVISKAGATPYSKNFTITSVWQKTNSL